MYIKKHESGNEYIYAGDVWVRNFTKRELPAIQLTHLFNETDFQQVMRNQQLNKNFPHVADEVLRFDKVLIISDGYNFKERHQLISNLPSDVCVLATNRSLAKWELFSSKTPVEKRKTINAYITNNPFKEALSFLPPKTSQYYPTCVASIRANHEFLKKYKGDVYTYYPSMEVNFGIDSPENYHIDDYRNPICAAIGFAFQLRVKKLMLLCCDDSFEENRDQAVQLKNGLYTYEPLIRSQKIIDANLYWLTHDEEWDVEVSDYSSGIEYENAAYIKNEEEFYSFFAEDISEGVNNEQQTNVAK